MRINRLAWALWTVARVLGIILLIPTVALQTTGVQRSYSGDYNVLFLIGVRLYPFQSFTDLLTARQIIISFLVNLPDLFCLLHAPHPTQVHIIHAFARAMLDAAASALLLVSYVMWQVFSCDYDDDSDDVCYRDDLVDASYQLSLFLSCVLVQACPDQS
jgi:hypothetical protein